MARARGLPPAAACCGRRAVRDPTIPSVGRDRPGNPECGVAFSSRRRRVGCRSSRHSAKPLRTPVAAGSSSRTSTRCRRPCTWLMPRSVCPSPPMPAMWKRSRRSAATITLGCSSRPLTTSSRSSASRGSSSNRRAFASPRRRRRPPPSATTSCEPQRCSGRTACAAAESWLPADVPAAAPFPLFVKPRNGSGGVGAFPARNQAELDFFTGYVDRPVVQEYLQGPEFTIDMLCNEGRPLAVVPRERVVIRAGVMDRGRTVRDRVAHRSGARMRRGTLVPRSGQHPVPYARQRSGGLRDQSAVLRRHPADHCRRRRFRTDAGRPRTGTRRLLRKSATSRTGSG